MDINRIKLNKTLMRVLETIADIISLAYSLQLLVNLGNVTSDIMFSIFLLNTCAYFLSAINTGRKDINKLIKYLVIACSYLLISLLIYLEIGHMHETVFIIYALTVIFVRVMALIRSHKLRNIIFGVLRILVWLYLIFWVLYETEEIIVYIQIVLGIAIPLQMFARVTVLSFSHIRYDILGKVIKKSMALEILSGLMILIVSFSFGFTAVEPGITRYDEALWYCFAIVTTIGFGDITAVTVFGRVLSVILGLYGIIVVALITSIIVNFYTEVNKTPESEEKESGEKTSEKTISEEGQKEG